MTRLKRYFFAMIFMAMLLTVHLANAAERMIAFEMGESGIPVAFPMTPEEIASEDAAYYRLIKASQKSAAGAMKNLVVFELEESGQRIEFPMTAAEITAANAENARRAAVKSVGTVSVPAVSEPAAGYELAESGFIIEFSAASPPVEMDEPVVAAEFVDKTDSRGQCQAYC